MRREAKMTLLYGKVLNLGNPHGIHHGERSVLIFLYFKFNKKRLEYHYVKNAETLVLLFPFIGQTWLAY